MDPAPSRQRYRLPRLEATGARPSAVLFLLGLLLLCLGLAMVVPLLTDLASANPDWRAFLAGAAVTSIAGGGLALACRGDGPVELEVREAFVLTSLAWAIASAFAALPFAFAAPGLSVADAYFEAVSGLTTTGSTVMVGLDHAPPGLLLWRALLQWIGGIGIIVFGIAVLPMLRVGGMQLFHTESSDRSDKILPRAKSIAGAIGRVYLGLSLLAALTYWLLGMSGFDAIVHAMTSIATGGYSSKDASFGHFQSPTLHWAGTFFMLSGAVPFVLYIQALRGQAQPLWRDAQLRWLLALLFTSWLVLALWLVATTGMPAALALRLAAFNATSIVTTTGYATADYGTWGMLAVMVFFFLTCVGGCTGSTAGGIKIFRFAVLYAAMRAQIVQLWQPHAVVMPTFGGRRVSDAVMMSVMAFFSLFALCFSVLAVLLGLCGLDFVTAMSGSITALANVGPGLGPIIGPVGNFQSLPDSAKWLLALGMLLGRLELFTVLVLLAPSFWRD
jgi:trk system potassium uptake protein